VTMKLQETKKYIDQLDKKRMAAGILLFNDKQELLIVKPTYKEAWTVPGGSINLNESPRDGVIREVKEEINLDINNASFLCVDYKLDKFGESLQFMFYGGVLTKEQVNIIQLQSEELNEYRFINVNKVQDYLSTSLGKRTVKCLDALKANKAIYLENQEYE